MTRLYYKVTCVLSVLIAFSGGAADPANVRTDEFSFIYPLYPSARSAGTAGSLSLVQDDLYSFKTNPAATALLLRPELSGALIHRNWNNTTSFHGSETKVEGDRSAAASIGVGFPFPVYRGSFVIGGGYFLRNLFTRDLLYSGIDETAVHEPRIQESILEDGKLGSYTIGFGTAVSPAVTAGVSIHFWTGDYYEDYWQINVPDGPVGALDSLRIDQYLDTNFEGMNMTMGACITGRTGLRMGISLDTPFTLDRSGYFRADTTWFSGDSLWITGTEYRADAQFHLPFIVRLGLAVPVKQLTIATSMEFTDLSSMDWSGRSENSYSDPRTEQYCPLFMVASGVEYAAQRIPLILRGGCRWESNVFTPNDRGKGRFGYFFGAGLVLQSAVSLDFAIGRIDSETSQSAARFSSNNTNLQLLLSTSVRL